MKHNLRIRISTSLLYIWVTFLISQAAFAQDHRVTGRVLSGKDQQPIPGVNILVRNTQLGATTDGNGNFTLNVPANAILVFSAIGFAGQTLAIGNQTQLTITLQEAEQSLGEVVVTALGIKKEAKRLLRHGHRESRTGNHEPVC